MSVHSVGILVALLVAPLAVSAPTTASEPQRQAASEPTSDVGLVILISIDQMRADYLDRFDSLLQGGLRRMVDEGAVFLNARQDHAITATAPGHAAMLSGLYPRDNGIVDNAWFDRTLQREQRASHDPEHRIVGLAVPDDGPGGSPWQFKGTSLVGWLRDRDQRSLSVSISRKDRSAVLMTPEAQHAYWFHWSGRFITSTHYRPELPEWVASFNETDWLAKHLGGRWPLLADEGVYALSRPDVYDGERGARGFGNTFPHPLPSERQPLGTRILTTPYMDQAVLDLGSEALTALGLGTDDVTDVLALGLSSTDSIGHAFGPFSREIQDQILRLDLMLGKFLDLVDARVGLDRTIVVLTSDHGVVQLPEYSRELGENAKRVRMGDLTRGIDRHLAADFGGEGWFESYSYGWLQVDREQAAELGHDAEAIVAKARQYLESLDEIAEVFSRADLLDDRQPRSELERLVRRSFYADRSGDLYLVHQPLHLFQSSSAANHQSPYDYDRHVPLILRGPGIGAGKYAADAAVVDIAPTLGALLGLSVPAGLEGTDHSRTIRP